MNQDIAQKVDDFFTQYRLRCYSKGQVLVLNGDRAPYVYHIITGKVKEYDVTYRGDEIILNVFKSPAFFPMSLAINKSVSSHIYEAETDIEVRQAPADEVVVFLRSNPDVMFDLLSRLYRGVDGLLGRMAHLMSRSARSRLLYELLVECRRFGKEGINDEYLLTIKGGDLAARAGLSRETVSREMQKLIADGLVTITSAGVTIKSLDALQQKIGDEL